MGKKEEIKIGQKSGRLILLHLQDIHPDRLFLFFFFLSSSEIKKHIVFPPKVAFF
jgi:hypothetical protein